MTLFVYFSFLSHLKKTRKNFQNDPQAVLKTSEKVFTLLFFLYLRDTRTSPAEDLTLYTLHFTLNWCIILKINTSVIGLLMPFSPAKQPHCFLRALGDFRWTRGGRGGGGRGRGRLEKLFS